MNIVVEFTQLRIMIDYKAWNYRWLVFRHDVEGGGRVGWQSGSRYVFMIRLGKPTRNLQYPGSR